MNNNLAINTVLQPGLVSGSTITVWPVITNSLGSTCMFWFFNEQDAITEFNNEKKKMHDTKNTNIPFGCVQCIMFAFEVDADASNEQITQAIDDFYDEVEFSKEFNFSSLVKHYPFTPEAWQTMLENHIAQ